MFLGKLVEKHLEACKNGEKKQHYNLKTICRFGDSLVPTGLHFPLPSALISFNGFSFSVAIEGGGNIIRVFPSAAGSIEKNCHINQVKP